MKRILIFLLLLFFIKYGKSQYITISGFISNIENNESIINAYIIEKQSKTIALSNEYGFFSIQLKKETNPYTLIISNVSYKTDTVYLNLAKDTLLKIELSAGKLLNEVEVTANKEIPIERRNEMSILSIPARQIEQLPALGGERDIIKAYQLMPGVQSGAEGSSGLLVRGGSKDQNLILIDGAPVYYINHLGGLVSVFNNEAINSSKLIKGGFPARYGGRLSSVLDINMKEGNNKKFGGSASIGLLSAKILLEGPIEKNKSSFLVSYRRLFYDVFMRMVTKLDSQGKSSSGYYFQDLNLKINRDFSAKDKLFVSMYYGDDKMSNTYKEKENTETQQSEFSQQWGNLLTSIRWNHLFGNSIFANISSSFTRYRFQTKMESEFKNTDSSQEGNYSFYTGIYDYSIHPNLVYYVSSKYKLRIGAMATYHHFIPGITKQQSFINGNTIIDKTISNDKTYAIETSGYIENDFSFRQFLFNIGFRISNFGVNKKNFLFLEPRILAKYHFGGKHAIEFSFSKMHQNVHLLNSSGVGIPIDFWLPASSYAPPSISTQYALGYSSTFLQKFEFSIEAFYKEMNHLITFKEGESYFGTYNTWEKKIETNGKGSVYGIDVLLQKKTGIITGWIGYTWMKNRRQFDQINNGEAYPYRYDRTHDISVVLNYKASKKIDLSITWVYGTGEALTLPIAKYYIPNPNSPFPEEINIYTKKNAFRAKAYHRLDFGVNFRKQKKWGERIWNISIYNHYNRKNPYSYHFSSDSETGKINLIQQSLFPFIPSVSYTVKF